MKPPVLRVPFLLFLIGCLVSQNFDSLEKGYLNQPPQDFWVKAVISLLTGRGFPTPCKRLVVYVFPFRNCYPGLGKLMRNFTWTSLTDSSKRMVSFG